MSDDDNSQSTPLSSSSELRPAWLLPLPNPNLDLHAPTRDSARSTFTSHLDDQPSSAYNTLRPTGHDHTAQSETWDQARKAFYAADRAFSATKAIVESSSGQPRPLNPVPFTTAASPFDTTTLRQSLPSIIAPVSSISSSHPTPPPFTFDPFAQSPSQLSPSGPVPLAAPRRPAQLAVNTLNRPSSTSASPSYRQAFTEFPPDLIPPSHPQDSLQRTGGSPLPSPFATSSITSLRSSPATSRHHIPLPASQSGSGQSYTSPSTGNLSSGSSSYFGSSVSSPLGSNNPRGTLSPNSVPSTWPSESFHLNVNPLQQQHYSSPSYSAQDDQSPGGRHSFSASQVYLPDARQQRTISSPSHAPVQRASPSLAVPTPRLVQHSESPPKLRSGLPQRNTWAMWVGSKSNSVLYPTNSLSDLDYRDSRHRFLSADVPADTTERELWAFFLKKLPGLDAGDQSAGPTGIDSIHLIARSVVLSRSRHEF